MFDDLQKRLSTAFKRFRVSGVLTEANMKEGLREVRSALLEADVNFNVVQEFMQKITDTAVGTQLIKSIRPEQQILIHTGSYHRDRRFFGEAADSFSPDSTVGFPPVYFFSRHRQSCAGQFLVRFLLKAVLVSLLGAGEGAGLSDLGAGRVVDDVSGAPGGRICQVAGEGVERDEDSICGWRGGAGRSVSDR